MKIAIMTSSKEVTNATTAPANIPCERRGNVMNQKVFNFDAPKLMAANSRDRLNPRKTALITMIWRGRARKGGSL